MRFLRWGACERGTGERKCSGNGHKAISSKQVAGRPSLSRGSMTSFLRRSNQPIQFSLLHTVGPGLATAIHNRTVAELGWLLCLFLPSIYFPPSWIRIASPFHHHLAHFTPSFFSHDNLCGPFLSPLIFLVSSLSFLPLDRRLLAALWSRLKETAWRETKAIGLRRRLRWRIIPMLGLR